MVAGENDHIVRIIQVDKADVLIDGVGSTLVPGTALAAHVGGQDVDAAGGSVQIPGLTAADVAVEFQRAVLGQHAHGVDTGIAAVGQGKVDDAILAAEGNGRLGHFSGQDVQSAALAAGQQHGDALFLHFFSSSFDACFFFLGLG